MAILFDATHSLHRTVFMNQDKIVENPDFAAHGMMFIILKSLADFGSSKNNPFVVCMDSKNSWRKQWYIDNSKNFVEYKGMTYKGNRTKKAEIPWEAVYKVYHGLMKALNDYSDVIILDVESAEADDCVYWADKYYKDKNPQNVIISSDKDFTQLTDKITSVYCPIKQDFKPEINKEWFLKYHTILGDKSDNILAIKKGVGPKTAEKMVSEIDLILQTNPTLKERYEFNKTLIDLECSPKEIGDVVYNKLASNNYNYNSMRLLMEFKKYSLNKASDQIEKLKLQENSMPKIKNIKSSPIDVGSMDEFFN